MLPEENYRLMLGSEKTGGHVGLFWVKSTLYQYLTKKYGEILSGRIADDFRNDIGA